MGLMRGMARTAVIAGTATGVSNRVSRRQSRRWADQDAQEQAQQMPAQEAYEDPTTAQLQQLAQLQQQGIITQEEFQAKKKQVLGI
jgi:membrane protease subunit (stomatin/prohibitin family)